MDEKLERYIDAFTVPSSGCREVCRCGKQFYDTYNHWDWDEGEYEKLEKDKKAVGVGHAVQRVWLGGTEAVIDCDCWHELAMRYIGFLETFRIQIGKYYDDWREDVQQKLNSIPKVNKHRKVKL
jgi:hypothetical protein